MSELLTVAEVAARLRKSPRFVRDQLVAKRLRGAKFGGDWHVAEADLEAYIEASMNISKVRRAAS